MAVFKLAIILLCLSGTRALGASTEPVCGSTETIETETDLWVWQSFVGPWLFVHESQLYTWWRDGGFYCRTGMDYDGWKYGEWRHYKKTPHEIEWGPCVEYEYSYAIGNRWSWYAGIRDNFCIRQLGFRVDGLVVWRDPREVSP